jgi:hypothetical protein
VWGRARHAPFDPNTNTNPYTNTYTSTDTNPSTSTNTATQWALFYDCAALGQVWRSGLCMCQLYRCAMGGECVRSTPLSIAVTFRVACGSWCDRLRSEVQGLDQMARGPRFGPNGQRSKVWSKWPEVQGLDQLQA